MIDSTAHKSIIESLKSWDRMAVQTRRVEADLKTLWIRPIGVCTRCSSTSRSTAPMRAFNGLLYDLTMSLTS
jgi:hypothetical protein